MIVVAIIGILAAVAIPAYSDYQAKSKLAAGLAEASAGRTAFEELKNNGETIGTDPTKIGLAATTQNCAFTVSETNIACAIQNAPTQVASATVTWTRDASTGAWSCATTGATNKELAPKSCKQS